MKRKNFISLILMLFVAISIKAQYQAQWVNPLPQGNTLNSAHFFDSNNGFVVGDHGTILKTNNAGATWQTIKTFVTENLKKVIFIDRNKGFAVGDKGLFLYTNDGGKKWLRKAVGVSKNLIDIHFLNASNGFILSERNILLKTVDGGTSWTQIQLPSRNNLRAMDFAGAVGVIAAYRYEIMKSNDGGNTWTLINLKTNANTAVQRANFSEVKLQSGRIILASKKNLFISSDNGQNWSTQVANSRMGYIQSMTLVNNNLSFLSDSYGNIVKSSTGLRDYQFKLGTKQKTKIRDIFMVNTSTGFAVGEGGRVLSTKDGGGNWKILTAGLIENFKDIDKINATTAYLLTDAGKIYKTINKGKTLTLVSDKVFAGGFTNAFTDLHFIDQDNGFASSSTGSLCTTKNGGQTWKKTNIAERKLSKFEFIDKRTGYVGSAKGVIYKTSDGGNTWNPIRTGHNTTIYDIDFANANVGYAAGDKGIALKTTDGGKTWAQIQTILKNNLLVVHATSPTTVMFSTSGNYSKMGDAPIIISKDGGASWNKTTIKPYSVYKFDFYNSQMGVALCSGGILATTVDGGQTWKECPSITNAILWGVQWKSPDELLVVGSQGAILKYTKGKAVANNDVTNKNNTQRKEVIKKNVELKRTLNGVPIEFSSIKSARKNKIGVLKKPATIKVGANVIPIATGATINYDSTKAIVTRVQIKKDTKMEVKGGTILVKGGTSVGLAQNHIISATIKEDVIINNETGAIPVKAKPAGRTPNITFTDKGDLSYAYLSKDFTAALDDQTLNIPAGSKLTFSYGKISKVNLTENKKVKLGNFEYEIEGKPGANVLSISTIASSGVFSSIRVTGGHTVHANDMDIPVKPGSYIVLTKKSGTYEVRKFDLGQAMTVDIHKKRKIKQRSLKVGKTLVVEDGKIIRVAL